MSDEENAYYGFFLVKLPLPVNGHYTLRAACFKKGSNFRRQLKLKVVETTKKQSEFGLEYGQLFQFSSTDEQLREYSIIVINEAAVPLFERNMLFPGSIRYRMKDVFVSEANLSTPGLYKSSVLGGMKDPLSIVQLGRMRLVEFEVLMRNKNDFSYEILEIPDMRLVDIINLNKMREGEVFEDGDTHQVGFNDKQNYALRMADNPKRRVVAIQGAPGTGKTRVLAQLLFSLWSNKCQAIVLTPTGKSMKRVRQMLEEVFEESGHMPSDRAILDIMKFEDVFNELDTTVGWKEDAIKGKMGTAEFKKKAEIYKQTEGGEEIIRETNIIFATFESPFIEKVMRYKNFEPCVLIIDNANNVSESQTLPAYFQSMRMVIAGDLFQLNPVKYCGVKTNSYKEVTVMDKIVSNKEKFSLIMFDEQYRCNEQIMHWSNETFYGESLQNKWNQDNTLTEYFTETNRPLKKYRPLYDPLVLIDTSTVVDEERVSTYERLSEDPTLTTLNYENIAEKNLALLHFKNLRKIGVAAKEIAILSCYKAQVNLIKAGMEDKIDKGEVDPTSRETTISTIDNVQGFEFECVIFSMVRSNPKKTMGIVTEPRRMNVLMTRARRQLFFIGNGFMMSVNNEERIRELLRVFCSSRHRFHPNIVSCAPFPSIPKEITNNFGPSFETFAKATNDNSMKAYCANKQKEFSTKNNN